MNRHHCAGRNGRIAAALTAALFIGVLAFALTPESVSAESGQAWSWQELQEQLSTIKNGTVLLRADCIAAEGDTHLVVPEGSRISLNLDGYTIDASAIKVDVHGQTPGLEMGSGIVVGGSLSIWDSDADKKGTITGMRGSGAISVSGVSGPKLPRKTTRALQPTSFASLTAASMSVSFSTVFLTS